MQHDDRLYLGHMLEMARKARLFVENHSRADFEKDEVLRFALRHLLQIIGEAAGRVSERERLANPQIPWNEIIGMRHRVVHDYLGIDEDIVWRTIVADLPDLIVALERLLQDLGD